MVPRMDPGPERLTINELDYACMVNVLKFQTLFSFCSQIKCRFSVLEFTKALSE